jgi:hypothetical protein
MRASGDSPVSIFCLQNQSQVNPANHKHVIFKFDLTDCLAHQTST